MKISERIEGTIENWRAKWADTLKGWMASWLEWGFERLFDAFEPGIRSEIAPRLNALKEIPGLPADIKDILDKATEEQSFIQFAALAPYLIGMLIGLGMGAAGPVASFGSYSVDKFIHSHRLDPFSIITAWRRDPEKYAGLFDDLKDQGWSDERIEALKYFTLIYPSRQDLQRYVAKEALEPEAIEKYGLLDEFDRLDLSLFAQIGVPEETAKLDWIAHWEHASWMQVVEMLHRGLLTEQEVWEWFRLVEIPPFWRQPLIDSAYTWPTRVDVRRWWDMRTIDETELRRLYSGMGYRGVNLDNYVLWTKVYVAFPDLMARWTNGWITEDDVRSELTALGMPPDRVNEMIQTKKKSVEAGQVDEGKALTKTEIYKGVKKATLTRAQGVDLLMDLNYTLTQAEYLLDVNVGALEGSPETYEEFKDITTKYKIAIGKEEKPMPEELKKAAAEVVRLTGEVESLARSIEEEKRGLVEEEVLPAEATKKRDELRVALHRAEAELQRVKTEYEAKVAEWRHETT